MIKQGYLITLYVYILPHYNCEGQAYVSITIALQFTFSCYQHYIFSRILENHVPSNLNSGGGGIGIRIDLQSESNSL